MKHPLILLSIIIFGARNNTVKMIQNRLLYLMQAKSNQQSWKQDGEWKIITVAAFWDYKNKLSKDNIQ